MEASVIACIVVGWQHVCSFRFAILMTNVYRDYGSLSPRAFSPVVNFKCSDLSVCKIIWLHALRVLALITTFIQDLGNTKS